MTEEKEEKENNIENIAEKKETSNAEPIPPEVEETPSSPEASPLPVSSGEGGESGEASTEPQAEEEESEEDELTGIEEATEQEIVQKVTKKETRKKRKRRGDKSQDRGKEPSEWIEKVVQIRRVTKVVKGGKKLSFRAVVVVGNAKGQVGVGVGKALEVIGAIQKSVVDAKKNLITVPLINSTIPHEILGRAGAAKVLLKPAREGTGIIAGGSARTVLELGGVGDILSKSLGSRSPLNVARATLTGLSQLRKFDEVAKLRGMTIKEMLGMGER